MLEKDVMNNSRTNTSCSYCNKNIFKIPYHIKLSKFHYCNMECRNKHYKERLKGNNNPFFGKKHSKQLINRMKIEFSGIRRSIPTEFKKGMLPLTFKGRTIDKRGYVSVYSPNHPHKDHSKCVLEHRLIMEKHIGRYLTRIEVVHHINGIKYDNRIENLTLCENNSIHMRLENKLRKLSPEKVLELRKLFKGDITLKELGIRFGVSTSCISSIKNGRSWKWIK